MFQKLLLCEKDNHLANISPKHQGLTLTGAAETDVSIRDGAAEEVNSAHTGTFV